MAALVGAALPLRGQQLLVITGCGLAVVGVVGVSFVLPWQRWPRWTRSVPLLLSFPVVVLVHEVAGVRSGESTALVVLPVLWLALHGERWALRVGVVLAGLAVVGPAVLAEGSVPLWQLGQTLVWLVSIWLLAPSVQALVARLRQRDTELTRLNSELDAAARQWELFGDQLADVVVMVVDWDLRYRQITGAGALRVGVEDWLGRTVWETSNHRNAEALVPLYVGALSGQPGTCELSATHSDTRHQVTAVPFTLHGEPAAMVVARDITVARRREDEIKQLNARVEQLVDESPVGVAVVGVDGAVTRTNSALLRILHAAEPARSTELTLASIGLPIDVEDLQDLLTTGAGARRTSEVQVDRPDREVQHLVVDVVPLAVGEGEERELLVNVHDVSAPRQLEERLRRLAAHDPLTGLANRRALQEAVERHLRATDGHGPCGALLLLDLDHFKQVNDTRGHDAGDRLLQVVADELQQVVRSGDLVARWGGDEFVVLMPRASAPQAAVGANRLVEAVRAACASTQPAGSPVVTASIGVAAVDHLTLTPRDLLARADRALYAAKAAGRDTHVVDTTQQVGSSLAST